MKSFLNSVIAPWLVLTSLIGQAAMEGAQLAPEPAVNPVWVGVFALVFIAACVWIGVAIYRSERKNKAAGGKKI